MTTSFASSPHSEDPLTMEIDARLGGSPLVIMLDIDGTLCELMPRPDDVRIPDETRNVLQQLALTRDVHVALVTGRSVSDALRVVGVSGVHVHGNHGMEISTPDGIVEVDSAARAAELAMRTAAATLERLTRDVPGALLEDKRYSLSLHYRLSPDDAVDRLRDTVRDVAERLGLLVTEGDCVLELRPQHAANKGNAVLRLAKELGAGRAEASLLFAGDDVTDEDAFRVLRTKFPHAVTINVGNRVTTTTARYRIDNPKQLYTLLERILRQHNGERGNARLAGEFRRESPEDSWERRGE